MSSKSLTPYIAGILFLIIGIVETLEGFLRESLMTVLTGLTFIIVAAFLFINNDDHNKKELIPIRVRAKN